MFRPSHHTVSHLKKHCLHSLYICIGSGTADTNKAPILTLYCNRNKISSSYYAVGVYYMVWKQDNIVTADIKQEIPSTCEIICGYSVQVGTQNSG